MMILHHLEQSRSLRILWALEELGADYQIKYYQRQPNYAAPEALKRIHPLGKSPILTDDDKTIAESAVILQYLQQHYDRMQQFKPKAEDDVLQYHYWMHYAESSLMPLLVFNLVLSQTPKHAPLLIRPVAKKVTAGIQQGFIQPRLAEHIAYLEAYLAEHDYFAGDFSFADIQMAFAIVALQPRLAGKYPHLKAYAERMQQRPAFQAAQAKSAI